MSHLFIVRKKDGFHINVQFSETADGDSYAITYVCTHRQPAREDGVYDFYDCHEKGFGGVVGVSHVSFNPKLFQVVEEREEVS